MEEHLLCCVHLLGQHTLVWELLPVLMCVLNLWHWSSLPAPAGASQPWLPFTSSLPSPGLRPWQGGFAPCLPSAHPWPFPPAQMPHQKEGGKSQYYRCKDTPSLLGLESFLSSTEGLCTQSSLKGKAVSALPTAVPENPEQRAALAVPSQPGQRCPVPCRAAHHKGVPELLSGSDSFRHQIPPVRQES